MGAIPTQRETASRASEARECPRVDTTLPGGPLAPGSARALLRKALTEWAGLALPGAEHLTGRVGDDATLIASELVTNAVVHAGTDVHLTCRLEEETGALVVEVSDRHPTRAPRGTEPEASPHDAAEYGRGLPLVAALSEAWGITYRPGTKTVWARLPAGGCAADDRTEAYAGEQAPAREPGVAEILASEPPRAEQGAHGPLDPSGATSPPGPVVPPDPVGPSGPPAPWDPLFAQGVRDSPGRREGAGGRDARRGGSYGDDWLARRHGRDGAWLGRGALSFLAEASDLLAGQLDEDLVAALTGQLIVPRLADWCAVWLEDETTGHGGWGGDGTRDDGARPARVWHASESRVEGLRRALDRTPPQPRDPLRPGPVPYPWPEDDAEPEPEPETEDAADRADRAPGTALAYRLVAGGRPLGTLVIGRAGIDRFPDEITGLVEDLGRRVALAIGAARQYARQATISAVLQRGLLPGAVAEIPGARSALVYEPCDKGGPSGDFYDLFPAGRGRWCFAVGDVQGKGPEAAVVIGLARPWLRLLAREGYRVADVLDRLNQLLLDDATEAADAAARALVAAGARPTAPGDGPQTRFLSLLYGELVPFDGGVRCTLASAGHPLPLLLAPDGTVRTVAQPQTLLGVVEDAAYTGETFELRSGDTLLCVTDGVTERRSGSRQFDDGDGLATALAGCAGLDAELIAERIQRLVHEFGARPPADDLALLVLQAE
ncbi:ATP-binding SpoIIE family protein phosphatase [Streptomyces griseomycini]|uniref:Serine phosphatase RsbU (Regulator of sigma subunit)/anti-sigma regulatory factor (Ser/Thr protein kinase) n=1 Tax=Streptomyces griseomycini TaxID=66895 RepID=A0A7W7PNT1_9ACTN|nr:ATP-binding SpoIIE family protein phosphatase [Streptomyces griseomycini]MBB4896762.1 serine phosphatase RsbU (regulator of sigma subunit)/anti-sigma regulatory factor (Ser/Thr protein kinase) [Streptomyces griseomycini]